jgi:hypothetical protein
MGLPDRALTPPLGRNDPAANQKNRLPHHRDLCGLWALEIADHAAARLLQRSDHADLRRAAETAALAFVAADAKVVTPLIGKPTSIYLPTGSGAFAATVIGGMTQTGKARIYARCRTCVPASWLNADQQFLPRATDVEQTVALDLWHWDKIGLPVLA